MRHRKRQPKLYDQHLEYIDPASTESAVGYIINKTAWGSFSAEIELMACERKVHWHFDSNSEEDDRRCLIKIDNALRILTRFREAYVKYAPAHRLRKKKK